MRLYEILGETMRRLGDIGCSHISIARATSYTSALGVITHKVWRFEPARGKRKYEAAYRFTVPGSAPSGTPRFADKDGVAWSSWIDIEGTHFGFSPEDVFAEDWVFVE